ncbi:MAG: GTP-binding protein [Caldimonas sp.]
MTARRRTPFTVIGGFLGAGKTSLVNHLLRESTAGLAGRRIAVLVNDFGAVNIDAALIDAKTADTIALSNGCVCCQIGDDLTMALVRILEAPEPFDAIVVEASGVSDPWRIAQIARADPTLVLEGVFVVVDASAIVAQSADPLLADTITRQLRAADLVLLNKVDLVDPPTLAAARDCVRASAGQIGIFETTGAAIPLTLLVGDRLEGVSARLGARSLREAAAAHGLDFESWTHHPKSTLSAVRVRAWLKAMPEGVLRLKGLVATDELPWAEIQFSGRHGSLRAALAPPPGGEAAIVAIGLRRRLPTATLAAAIDACSGVVDI